MIPWDALPMKTVWIFVLVVLTSCAGRSPKNLPLMEPTSSSCQVSWMSLDEKPVPALLRGVNSLYQEGCDNEVMGLGRLILERSRDKVYSISREASEFFLSDGVSTDYVLEGYERVYLSLLMSMSALRSGRPSLAEMHLRKAGEDQRAQIANPTDDPVLTALQATLWENLGQASNARPYWKRLREKRSASGGLRAFADAQIKRLDRDKAPTSWIISVSPQRMPAPRWKSTRFSFEGQIYDFQPDRSFVPACEAPAGSAALMATESWFQELRNRHSIDRRPLTMAKGLTRGAIGVTFAATVGAAGVGLAVLGCGSERGSQAACEASLKMAFALASLGFTLTESYLEPDVRHWENLPGGFYLSRGTPPAEGACS
ncbi:MAG TPA: hypothetical protein PL182_12405, partial [Pseudobdellovibrionaceae bacterium]|nr:hypothetical protein [Pseudobdellovibrionaceae bacterium]